MSPPLSASSIARALGYSASPAICRRALAQTSTVTSNERKLNGPIRDKQVNLVIANMERWRWYPRDLGAANVIVNQPDFTLKVMHGSQICSRLGRCLRQLDIVLAHTFIGETPGLQMPGEGQHGLRELEIGLRECVRAKPGKIGRR